LQVQMKPRQKPPFIRGLCLFTAFFVFVFLVESAPHRVHHFFEEFPDPQPEGHADHHQNPSRSTPDNPPCIAQSVAQSCHLNLIASVSLPRVQTTVEAVVLSREAWIPNPTPSPFSKRAPPLV
jgi:hypothetical protein